MNQFRLHFFSIKNYTILKNAGFKLFAILIATVCFTNVFAQINPAKQGAPRKVVRCATTEYYREQEARDPQFRAKAQAEANRLLQAAANRNASARPANTNGVMVIPVVFHVIGTAANQAFASDAMLQRQIDVLNRDWGGLNPDSIKIPPVFKAEFGHSVIRFALAKRSPTGAATNGIERRISAATYTANTHNDMKHTAAGGMDQWDGTLYYNVWLGTFTDGLLGIATFPNTSPANEQGVCIDLGSIDQPCNSPFAGSFDGGRTLVHETGHYMYLFHIWGDDGGACTGSDWGSPYGALPASCTDDTPNQADASSGCLSGVQLDACATTAPGFMYQNYMDYTDDACYGMFTVNQNCRAENALTLYRSTLLTSPGLTAPTPINNNARISEITNPESRGYACGASTSISLCNGNSFSPNVMLVNDGDAPLTSTTFKIFVNNVLLTTQNWTGNIVPGDFAWVTLAPISPATGTNQKLMIVSSNPNGQPDGNTAGDTCRATYSLSTASSVLTPPMPAESFQNATFPPTNWQNNPTGANGWARSTNAGNPGNASSIFNCFNIAAGGVGYLVTPKFTTAGAGSFTLNFNVAYAQYDAASIDRLEIVYSTDCGTTWLPTGYDKQQAALATNGGAFVTANFIPTANQWRTETVNLSIPCGAPTAALSFAFRATSGFGNNIYVDNVSVSSSPSVPLNAGISGVTYPSGIMCPNVFQPIVTLNNFGTTDLTSVTFNYKVDAAGTLKTYNWTGNLPGCAGASTVVTLPAYTGPTTTGNHTFLVYTTNPNGSADQAPGNDTARSVYVQSPSINLPINLGFNSNPFPPTGGYAIINPDAGITWARTNTAGFPGGSIFMDAFNYQPDANGNLGQVDIFRTPNIGSAWDTLNIEFDVAYAQYDATSADILEVVYSNDCGATWLPTGYRKSQSALATNGGAFVTAQYVPAASEWRHEKIKFYSCTNASTMIGFKFTNGFGNELYVDNINITGIKAPQYDAAPTTIYPYDVLCGANTFTPSVTIVNHGSEELDSVTINYQLDNGPVNHILWHGVLARCIDTTTVTLTPLNIAAGLHTLTVFTSNPDGVADQRPSNDTLKKTFFNAQTIPTPVSEGFESTSFPPANWFYINPDGSTTWKRSTQAAKTGIASMTINGFNYPTANNKDMFVSSVISNNATIDSMFVSFDYSYKQGLQYPGSTVLPLDTLEVMVTTDCGATYQSVWKKWGNELQTVNDPNISDTLGYVPSAYGSPWRNINIYLTPYVNYNNYQVYFVAKTNKQNNIWMDNINIYSKTLPQRLKDQGYLIYPNPFSNSFLIHHTTAPVDLQATQVYNSTGQLVWEQHYNGDASNQITVDMKKMASGVYVLKMVYSNKTIVERLVKN